MTEVICENGLCRLVEVCTTATNAVSTAVARVAQGYMSPSEFLAFLNNTPLTEVAQTLGVGALALAFLGGLALNLTPCVLPMVPVNLLIVGRSLGRGLSYAAGIAVSFGALGLAAALGGLAFGTIQSTVWFNVVAALVFIVLGVALAGAFNIDLARYRFRAGAFVMGSFNAFLAGACVAPVVLSVLLLTAELYAKGEMLALVLPFAMGLGMATPWPFAALGLRVLPKPGGWMKHVNRIFVILIFALAAWHGYLAIQALRNDASSATPAIQPAEFEAALAKAPRPVLVDCGAVWCKNCVAMERTTLRDAKVREALKRFTVLRLNADDLDAVRHLPGFGGLMGLPAYLIFDSEELTNH